MATTCATGVSAGAGAATVVHVPSRPARLHCSSGPGHDVSQQTASTQLPEAHVAGSAQLPPLGIGVLVGVSVAVGVTVEVGVGVGDGSMHVPPTQV